MRDRGLALRIDLVDRRSPTDLPVARLHPLVLPSFGTLRGRRCAQDASSDWLPKSRAAKRISLVTWCGTPAAAWSCGVGLVVAFYVGRRKLVSVAAEASMERKRMGFSCARVLPARSWCVSPLVQRRNNEEEKQQQQQQQPETTT